ncbi:hypothetical protein LSH36_118g02005 [Paralvinella palmiformis]|uniref:Uncharacterized protein n=1 Tax=Paralvinella palmiformis TaxID=53620 RepID=A0AAD9JXZ2_9ANNE|nr:hypothetical protein LSH36_118g02005 [Paralvinella palmiformis]
MGQQESYTQEGGNTAAPSRGASTSEDVSDRANRPVTASTTGHTGRRRVDKLLRRAQNTLEAKLRGRDRSASPSLGKTSKKDTRPRSSGSLEPSPKPSYSQSHSTPEESSSLQDVDVKSGKHSQETGISETHPGAHIGVEVYGEVQTSGYPELRRHQFM